MEIIVNPDPITATIHGVIEFRPESEEEEKELTAVVEQITESNDIANISAVFHLPKISDYPPNNRYRKIAIKPEYPGACVVAWKFDPDNYYSDLSESSVLDEFSAEGFVADGSKTFEVIPPVPHKVELVPSSTPSSYHTVLWNFIESISERLRFEKFINAANTELDGQCGKDNWHGTGPYERLDRAASVFVNSAADPRWVSQPVEDFDSSSTVPEGLQSSYVYGIGKRSNLANPFLANYKSRCWNFPFLTVPMVELIWNYWMEEGMLVQTMNRILARFQNRIADNGRDPLARLSVSPLLPLRSLLWGFAESERERLSVRRRAAEYEYQYGLHLVGRAIPPRAMAVERRSQFLEAFHSLLNATHHFYKEYDDKTVQADAFPLLSSLRELHLILAYGANNQFADLPLTARQEMIVMQFALAQPEMREFLGGRAMVPYEEEWMDRVDTMKSLQNWSDVSISHFFDLAVHGERLLLSVRHGQWNDSGIEGTDAENWALRFRNSVQRYIHAYRAVTGVDLMVGVDATMPSTLLAQRLRHQYVQRT
ncbi:hypothetical protein [Nocardia sp. NPDC050793]|uniref:hypothetical protein n=1 Tax=Nocardia sp. NPDC050793 TaxID=3155159 RepID=UPI0033CB5573